MGKRIAVIGAGPSGLAQLRAFQSLAATGAEIPEIVCFEKQPDWGGLWRYTYLWSNGPKEGLEFADYTFEDHFGGPIASYPPRAVLFDYIEGRVKKAGVRDMIRFNTNVRDVRKVGGQFEVTARDGVSDSETVERFDHVVVATGHFSVPNVPHYPGFESFNGGVCGQGSADFGHIVLGGGHWLAVLEIRLQKRDGGASDCAYGL